MHLFGAINIICAYVLVLIAWPIAPVGCVLVQEVLAALNTSATVLFIY